MTAIPLSRNFFAGFRRDLRARDRRPLTNIVEHNLTIDIANRVGARNTSCFQVYSTQRIG